MFPLVSTATPLGLSWACVAEILLPVFVPPPATVLMTPFKSIFVGCYEKLSRGIERQCLCALVRRQRGDGLENERLSVNLSDQIGLDEIDIACRIGHGDFWKEQ